MPPDSDSDDNKDAKKPETAAGKKLVKKIKSKKTPVKKAAKVKKK